MAFHKPVLVEKVVEILLDVDGELFIDCTLGAGGHSEALFEAADHPIRILGIDKDPDALSLAAKRLAGRKGITIERGSYVSLDDLAAKHGFIEVDGILADFGQSSDQLEDPARGFSYRTEGPLDMRYDPYSGTTAAEIVNECSRTEIAEIIRCYGQERMANRIAVAIVRSRPLHTTTQLSSVVRKACPGAYIEKTLARVFMALRVFVNDELSTFKELLPKALGLLRIGGRMVFISYDSNQDRIVKEFFRTRSQTCTCPPGLPVCVCDAHPELKILTHRVIKPGTLEIETNPRSRSARLRAAQKI